jgi:hypothetical protein
MKEIKVISIRQPWAYLIAKGEKDVENRTWTTNYRGELYIHSAKTAKSLNLGKNMDIPKEKLVFGAIIAKCNLVAIVRDSTSKWALPEHYHWVLADVEPIEPIYLGGKQGLWHHLID